MRFEVECVKEINGRYADRVFVNKVGEKLELSAAGVETALSTHLDGAYRLSREIPETFEEKAAVKSAEQKAKLLESPKKKLAAKAKHLKVAGAGTMAGKEPLVEAITALDAGNTSPAADNGISNIAADAPAKSVESPMVDNVQTKRNAKPPTKNKAGK